MTLWNADLAIGPVLNIQRIRTDFFYDLGYGNVTSVNSTGQEIDINKNYWSAGVEFKFDFNFMRLLPLLNAGLRTVYTPDSKWNFEVVIGNIQI